MSKFYTFRRFSTIGPFQLSADFRQAAATIYVRFPDGNDFPADDEEGWQATPYQVADARHFPQTAARIVAHHFR